VLAAFYGMTGVMLGALGAHALKKVLSERLLASFTVGTRYQMYHALFLLLLGLLYHQFKSPLLSASIVLAGLGVLLFSGSIYLLALMRWTFLGPVTPLGGLCFIASWLLLLIAAFRLSL
jgi:uncharacterized membrane protein YgdD (TMEM256/DUF423 family)